MNFKLIYRVLIIISLISSIVFVGVACFAVFFVYSDFHDPENIKTACDYAYGSYASSRGLNGGEREFAHPYSQQDLRDVHLPNNNTLKTKPTRYYKRREWVNMTCPGVLAANESSLPEIRRQIPEFICSCSRARMGSACVFLVSALLQVLICPMLLYKRHWPLGIKWKWLGGAHVAILILSLISLTVALCYNMASADDFLAVEEDEDDGRRSGSGSRSGFGRKGPGTYTRGVYEPMGNAEGLAFVILVSLSVFFSAVVVLIFVIKVGCYRDRYHLREAVRTRPYVIEEPVEYEVIERRKSRKSRHSRRSTSHRRSIH